MTGKIRTAFDGISAGENLKLGTLLFLRKELQRRGESRNRAGFRKYVFAFASAAVIFLSGIFAYNAYYTPAAYVDVDINPSVELALNRFDRVIGAHSYNGQGEELVKNLSIKYRNYDDALVVIMEAMAEHGYFQDGELVSITLQTDNKNREADLLASIQTGIQGYLTGRRHTAQLDVFPVSVDTRSHSHELGISPAKYLALQELIEADPTASIESCLGHSISEIRQLTQKHAGHHGNSGDTEFPDAGDVRDSRRLDGHHGEDNGLGSHGSGH